MHPRLSSWFAQRGWTPFEFQLRAWEAHEEGRSGLVHAPTGMGKTLSLWGACLNEWLRRTGASPTPLPLREGRGEGTASSKRKRADAAVVTTTIGRHANPGHVPLVQSGRFSQWRTRPSPGPSLRGRGVKTPSRKRDAAPPIEVLWLTPLRALANDLVRSMREPVDEMALPWSVELRTSDTSSTLKRKQRDRLPTALITTPESLSLLLSYPGCREKLATLRTVVCDEWHEMLGGKRGVQVELALARLRSWNPALRVWGLSATIGNLDEALKVLCGSQLGGTDKACSEGLSVSDVARQSPLTSSADSACQCHPTSPPPPILIHGQAFKKIEVTTLIPPDIERFPWAGHLGVKQVEPVIAAIESASSTLVFTNTRSQAELWFAHLTKARPDWLGTIAIHHGSVDRAIRHRVEAMLGAGKLRAVICTSSLDLGVDFSPVDQVMQIGSPKGIARLMQRAGRSGHQPGKTSKVVCVPTHAFELIEFAAARDAIEVRDIEVREPLKLPMDVLAQHLVTLACGEGFLERELLGEVRTTHAFSAITDEQWRWVMDFVTRGGESLRVYPQFQKVTLEDGRHVVRNPTIARFHRLSIGTITDDSSMLVRYRGGKTLGNIEENFIAMLRPGDAFMFAGKVLELIQVREMSAFVKPSKCGSKNVPRWNGARFPLSTQLAARVRKLLREARDRYAQNGESHGEGEAAREGEAPAEPFVSSPRRRGNETRAVNAGSSSTIRRANFDRCGPKTGLAIERLGGSLALLTNVALTLLPAPPEMLAIDPLLQMQRRMSVIPAEDELLIEPSKSREGYHLFFFPFAGRLVNEGLGTLMAHRWSRLSPRTINITANDYGIELLSPSEPAIDRAVFAKLISPDRLLEDLIECVNIGQMARRAFREIARVAGLIMKGFPGQPKSNRHLQASSELFFDVFNEFDPKNLLLEQARREVLAAQLEFRRLDAALRSMNTMRHNWQNPRGLTPLAFPIWADRLREQHVSTESWRDRVLRMSESLEKMANG